MPRALDELHDADPMPAAEHAQSEPKGCRRLALAGSSVDDQQAFLDGFGGDLGVLNRLALRHLGAMAFCLGVLRCRGHSVPFTGNGNPATMSTTRSAVAATR